MYLKAIKEMYPDTNIGRLCSGLSFYDDWERVRAVAALKAFNTMKNMITDKRLVYHNNASLSDYDDFHESVASYMQKSLRKQT
jgi:hypothetical protein